MKKQLSIILSLAVAAASGETLTYEWDGTTTSYGDGKVLVEYDENSSVASLTANVPKGDRVVFTGGTVSLAADAEVSLAGLGSLVFSNAVSAAGAVSFSGGSPECSYEYTGELSEFYQGKSLLMFPGLKNLEGYRIVSGSIGYAISSNPRVEAVGSIYFHEEFEGGVSAQIQNWNGGATRCVMVVLKETADGVVVSNALTRTANENVAGVDFRDGIGGSARLAPLKLGLRCEQRDGLREVVLAGRFTAGGAVTMRDGVRLLATADAVNAKDFADFTVPLNFSNGTFCFWQHGDFTNSAAISGSYGEVQYVPAEIAEPDVEEVSVYEGDLPGTDTLILPNTDIAAIANITARIKWSAYNSTSTVTPTVPYRGDLPAKAYREDGLWANCRFHADRGNNGMAFAAQIRLTQKGPDVFVRKIDGYYSWTSNQPTAADPSTWDPINDPSTAATLYSGPYKTEKFSITNLTFRLLRPTGKRRSAQVFLAGNDSSDRSSYRFCPAGASRIVATVTRNLAVPHTSGEIHVHSNACLRMYTDSSPNWSKGLGDTTKPATHFVHNGGRAYVLQEQLNSIYQTIRICGGDYWFYKHSSTKANPFGYDTHSNEERQDYLAAAVYSDGGRTKGESFKLGRNDYKTGTLKLSVTGSKPCFSENGWDIGHGYLAASPAPFELSVADVTGSADIDFTVEGMLNARGVTTMSKTGPGTVLLTSRNQMTPAYPVAVRDGTILMGVSDCFNADQSFALQGGSLAFTANTTNVLASVSLSETSGLVLADGASVTIGDSSGIDWADGKILNITGDPAKIALRFGDSAGALTERQQRKLRLNGKRCLLDDGGNVKYGSFGVVLIVR